MRLSHLENLNWNDYCDPGSLHGKESAYNSGDVGLIPGSGKSFEKRHGNPLQYSCLENPMDRGAWQANGPWGHKESDTTEQPTLSLCSVLPNHENVCHTRNKNRGKYGRSRVT